VRICVVTEDYYPAYGGIAEQVHHFAREARRLGHGVKILTGGVHGTAAEAEDRERGYDVVRLGRSRALLRGGSAARVTSGSGIDAAVREVLARERFDVVHVHDPLTPVLPLLAVHHARGPVVGTFHARARPAFLFRFARKALQRYLDRLDAAIAVSKACLEPLRGRVHGDVRIIPGGIDLDRFARGRQLRRFDDGKLNVLWAGRIERHDGLDVMLAAFHRAWKQIDVRLIVLGDGPLLPRYRAMVPREAAEDVEFAGCILDERPDWYASADVVCAPAQSASEGVALLEAMAASKPVLASDVEGHREVLQHGREGELITPDDVGAWARAIVRLSREPVRAAAYGERGRLVAQRHAWPAVAREVLGLYRSVGARG
jgi:phosphatidylinositol alpha-mannosyltransferase